MGTLLWSEYLVSCLISLHENGTGNYFYNKWFHVSIKCIICRLAGITVDASLLISTYLQQTQLSCENFSITSALVTRGFTARAQYASRLKANAEAEKGKLAIIERKRKIEEQV